MRPPLFTQSKETITSNLFYPRLMLRDTIGPEQVQLKFQCQHLADALYAATEEAKICLIGPSIQKDPLLFSGTLPARGILFLLLFTTIFLFLLFSPLDPDSALPLSCLFDFRSESAIAYNISKRYSSRCAG